MSDADTLTVLLSSDDRPIDSTAVKVPRLLGPVRLTREIGRGGMGVVWLARHELLARDVAVKFLLRAAPAHDDPAHAAILDEARLAAALRHPGIVSIHHADLFDGVPYFIMDYIDGPSLADLIEKSGPLSWPPVFELLQAVCDALGQLHDRELVHRDIKPANILLDSTGRPFITDFGLARARTAPDRSTANAAGTPVYMAPESFEGVFSPRSDVYSLALTTYQLLTGLPPFLGSLVDVMRQHRETPFPTDLLRLKSIDPQVIEVLERAAHKNPLYRFKTAAHMLQALRAAQPRVNPQVQASLSELLVARHRPNDPGSPELAGASQKPSSYHEEITRLAEARRHAADTTHLDAVPTEPVPRPLVAQYGPTVDVDLPCVDCGYNLRTLAADAQCPECKAPVAASLDPNLLRYADSSWLATISRGLLYIAVANLAAVPADAVSAVADAANSPILALVARFMMMCMACVSTGGVFMLLRPERRPASGGLRRALRILAVMSIVPSIVALPALILNLYDVLAVAVRIEFVIVPVLYAGLLVYLSRLANRIPSPSNARQATIRATLMLVPTALQIAGLMIDSTWDDYVFELGPSGGMLGLPMVVSASVLGDMIRFPHPAAALSSHPAFRLAATYAIYGTALAFLVLFLLTTLLFIRFRNQLTRVIDEATELRSRPPLSPLADARRQQGR